ncbi:phosphoserine aminotransferase [Microbacterium terricola]|uniref:phosphoserine transaminase n=2 Tax=Microbacterium terricola TaxID=344163 RepID=A0ABM8E035_9MICO|nr:phosphoserine aminotransferase [Microbacterium terricola]
MPTGGVTRLAAGDRIPRIEGMAHVALPREILPADGRFGCGPSKVRDEHLAALVGPGSALMGTSHRQSPVKSLVGQVRVQLSDLFRAPSGYEIIVGNGGSTAFWDAAAFGLIEKRSQNLVFGEFGGKFAAAAAAPWLEAPDVRSSAPGTSIAAEAVEGVDVYAWPHNETSTGVATAIQRVEGDEGALTVIDATSAAGGINFSLHQADVYYFAPQKNLGSDGGLWFAAVSPAAIERIERIAASGRYIPEFLSLKNALDNSRLNQTLNTPALSTLFLLDKQLEWITANGGLQWADGRTRESSSALYAWAEASSFATPFVADPADRSPVVVTIDFDESVDAAAVAKSLRSNGIVDTEPYRKLGRNQLRIATFVSVEPDDVRQLIRCIDYTVDGLRG